MKVLITGGNGQVAYDLILLAKKNGYQFFAPTRSELDITDIDAVTKSVTEFQPDYVINTAAFTAVDLAETDQENAFAINRDGAKNLAMVCEKLTIPLIHLSTDYVFDGEKKTPYTEDDQPAPLSVYGQSKYEGELAVQKHAKKHIILRVSGVFGVHGKNFVKTIQRLASEREELRIVMDQVTCPTPAADIAAAIFKICEQLPQNPAWGVYHFCGKPAMTWFDFAKKIIAEMPEKKVKSLVPITTAEFAAPAKRPANSVLDCAKIEKVFRIMC